MSDSDRFNSQASDGSQSDSQSQTGKDEELLKKIREDYRFCLDYWQVNRDEGAIDLTFAANNPWTREEVNRRAGRPCITWDEISQYIKQANNNIRQNKRAIKVIPRGEGATDADAEKRAAIIRGIEHASNAQAAYTTAFEGATTCWMGAWRITTKQMPGGSGFAVEPRIKRIPNSFSVLLDPEALEADFSDQNICFVTDVMRKETFSRKYPKAAKRSFTPQDEKSAPDWFKGDSIMVAEYWTRKAKSRKKLRVKGPAGETTVFEDEIESDSKPEILDSRDITEFTVTQYITNGVEILEENEWPGSWIPIIPVLGEEIYTNESGSSKRIFMSLIRRARGPQKSLNYLVSQEMEEFAMAPRTPLLLWEGQEEADQKALKGLNDEPHPYIRLKRIPGQDGIPVADLPGGGRIPFEPNAQSYEIAREAARRAIQSAIGFVPQTSASQKDQEKSGIAIERIQTQEAIGSFHFTDNLDRAIENGGRQLNELITRIMDTPRKVGIRNPDETHALLTVMAQEHAKGLPGGDSEQDDYLITDRGEFDVTISTGPSDQSQREDSSEFADKILETAEGLAQLLPQGAVAKLLALAIRMKNIGHIGEEMAEIISPENDENGQLMNAQMQIQQMQQAAQEMQKELEKLRLERAGKVIENEYKTQFEMLRADTDRKIAQLNADLKAYIANVQTKAQDESERRTLFQETQIENHHSAHEIAMQKDQQAHEKGMAQTQQAHEHALADKQATNDLVSQVGDHAHEQQMAENEQLTSPKGE